MWLLCSGFCLSTTTFGEGVIFIVLQDDKDGRRQRRRDKDGHRQRRREATHVRRQARWTRTSKKRRRRRYRWVQRAQDPSSWLLGFVKHVRQATSLARDVFDMYAALGRVLIRSFFVAWGNVAEMLRLFQCDWSLICTQVICGDLWRSVFFRLPPTHTRPFPPRAPRQTKKKVQPIVQHR